MPSSATSERAERALRAARMRLGLHAPFFGTLALFAELREAPERTETAATDGKHVFYCPDFVASLTPRRVSGLLLHEVLHAALLHVQRRGTREAMRWNVAADIVVNGIVRACPWAELPDGAVVSPRYERFTVEEVYELLASESRRESGAGATGEAEVDLGPFADLVSPGDEFRSIVPHVVEAFWARARAQASVIETPTVGHLGLGLVREIERLSAPSVDWREELWRFAVRTPDDFGGWDLRFVHRGLYLESLEIETLALAVAVDTSGSIEPDLLDQFIAEVVAITQLYPKVRGSLYFADAELYGPHPLDEPLPSPRGDGGTIFVPFFDALARRDACSDGHAAMCAVYLTDGFGEFPSSAPRIPVLWVVPPGGADAEAFPFGRVVRMLSDGSS